MLRPDDMGLLKQLVIGAEQALINDSNIPYSLNRNTVAEQGNC